MQKRTIQSLTEPFSYFDARSEMDERHFILIIPPGKEEAIIYAQRSHQIFDHYEAERWSNTDGGLFKTGKGWPGKLNAYKSFEWTTPNL